jgi:uncharacterized repeat protein (TIGR01451 family)
MRWPFRSRSTHRAAGRRSPNTQPRRRAVPIVELLEERALFNATSTNVTINPAAIPAQNGTNVIQLASDAQNANQTVSYTVNTNHTTPSSGTIYATGVMRITNYAQLDPLTGGQFIAPTTGDNYDFVFSLQGHAISPTPPAILAASIDKAVFEIWDIGTHIPSATDPTTWIPAGSTLVYVGVLGPLTETDIAPGGSGLAGVSPASSNNQASFVPGGGQAPGQVFINNFNNPGTFIEPPQNFFGFQAKLQETNNALIALPTGGTGALDTQFNKVLSTANSTSSGNTGVTFGDAAPFTNNNFSPDGSGGNGDTVQSAALQLYPVGTPDVDISKTADASPIVAGQTAGFTVTLKNDGSASVTGLVLNDPLPTGLGHDTNWVIDTTTGNPGDFQITGTPGSNQVLSLSNGLDVIEGALNFGNTLMPGQTVSVHITSPTTGADTSATTFTGTLPNTATVTATNEPTEDVTGDHTASASVVINAPDVDITKTADAATITAGQTAGFTVTVFNEGKATASSVVLNDPLPAGLDTDVNWTIDTTTGNPTDFTITGAKGSQVLSLTISTLTAGQTISVHITSPTNAGDAPGGTGTLPNTATVKAPNQAGGETQDQSSATITVTTSSPVSAGEFATIGFWHNKNGQAVINSFNGGPSAKLLGHWLATTWPNLFGAPNPYDAATLASFGATTLDGLTNAQVATVYANLWNPSGVTKNTYVQAFAVALGIYADTVGLGYNSTGAGFGFIPAPGGGANLTISISGNTAAFPDFPGKTTLTVAQVMFEANKYFDPTTGLFYGGDQTKTSDLNNVLNAINTQGDIS